MHDALDTFLYSKNTETLNAPYVRDSIDLKRTMILVVLALLPTFFFGTYNIGLQSPDIINKDFLNCFIFSISSIPIPTLYYYTITYLSILSSIY